MRSFVVYLHDRAAVPEKRVRMEIKCGIKPKSMPLLSIASAIDINISLNKVWLSGYIAKKFKV